MPSLSPRETFDRHVHRILDEVLVLGSMVEQAILDAVEALKNRDLKSAEIIYRSDDKINAKRYSIESDCLILIATQQPMARDLRVLAAILEIITELERMGDYAKGIARITLLLAEQPVPMALSELDRMARLGLDMLRRALDAFVNRDAEAARQIPKADDEVDDLYNQIYRDLINKVIEDPTLVDRANYLIWAAHNLERMADRVTNICERIVFVVTGEMRELDASDDEAVTGR